MAANATQKAHVLRNLGHIESMTQFMIETAQFDAIDNTIKNWRGRNGCNTKAVKVNGCTDAVLIAAWGAIVSTFVAS